MASKATLILSLLLLSLFTISIATSTSQQLQWCKQQCHQQHEGQQQQGQHQQGQQHQKQHHQFQDPQQCERSCEQKFGQGQQQSSRHQHGGSGGGRGQSTPWGQMNVGGTQRGGVGQVDTNNPYFYGQDNFVTRVRTEHGHYRVLEPFTQRSNLLSGIQEYRFAVLNANPQTFIVPHHTDADGVFFVIRGRGSITVLHEDNRETHDIRQGDIYRVPAGATVYIVNSHNNENLYIAKIFRTISTPGEFKEFIGAGGQNPESFYTSFSGAILESAFNTPFDDLQRLFGQQQQGGILQASEQMIQALTGTKSIFSESGTSWPFSSKSSKPYNILRQRPAHANSYGQLYEANQHDYEELRELDIDVSVANMTSGAMMLPHYSTKATKFVFIISGTGYAEIVCPHVAEMQMQQGTFRRGQQGQQGGFRTGQQGQQGQQQGGGFSGGQQGQQGWEYQTGQDWSITGGQGRQQQQSQEWSQGGGFQSSNPQRQQGFQGQQQSEVHYQKVGSVVSEGDAFVVPAGHPVALVNTWDDNLVVLCFCLKAKHSKLQFLAGTNNILNQMTDEAKALSFGVEDSSIVDQIFNAQQDEVFASAPGPSGVQGGRQQQQGQQQAGSQSQQRQGTGQQYVSSILEAVAGM